MFNYALLPHKMYNTALLRFPTNYVLFHVLNCASNSRVWNRSYKLYESDQGGIILAFNWVRRTLVEIHTGTSRAEHSVILKGDQIKNVICMIQYFTHKKEHDWYWLFTNYGNFLTFQHSGECWLGNNDVSGKLN